MGFKDGFCWVSGALSATSEVSWAVAGGILGDLPGHLVSLSGNSGLLLNNHEYIARFLGGFLLGASRAASGAI